MELLEREAVLAELSAARDDAARGRGQVAFVSGEAGIGKTSVVRHFVEGLGPEARVLWGACDDLAVPRPLGPFHDMADGGADGLAAPLGSGERAEVFRGVLEALRERRPTVCVIEDAHWADQASLDVLTYLGRRIEGVPALVVLTFRDDELALDHPLRRALGAVPRGSERRLELVPLSRGAVGHLAGGGPDAEALYEVTGGNPFFVTEALGAGLDRIPGSVRDAVLGRAARLSPAGRAALELVSVVPARSELWLLDACLGPPARDALAECEDGGLVVVEGGVARFRHELARRAVEETLAGSRRVELNRRVLAALREGDAEPARLAHHADLADDPDAVLRHALEAGRTAAAAGAHREATALLALALRHGDRLPPADRASALEDLSSEAYYAGRPEFALPSRERAVTMRRGLGDALRTGDSLRWLSRLRWWMAEQEGAEAAGAEAVALLETLGPSRELAMALSNASQLAMLGQRHDEALALGERAMAMAREQGEIRALVHAENNVGCTLMRADRPEGRELLERSARQAMEAGLDEDACRALVNLAWMERERGRYDAARRAAEEGLAFARDSEQRAFHQYLSTTLALIDLTTGDWDAALARALALVGDPDFAFVGRVPALQVVALVELRRGDPRSARARLDEALPAARASGELQRLRPIAAAYAEAAWLEDDPAGVDEATREAWDLALRLGHGWDRGDLALWRRRAGVLGDPPGGLPEPYARQVAGDWRGAADVWGEWGAPYERALALLDAPEAPAVAEALGVLEGLGATAVTRIARARLRGLGIASVPRGPRRSTRANPAGLSPRQLEVAALLAQGLSNPEIARRLVLSGKTVEHHVAAVAAKLGVRSRREVPEAARRLGVPLGEDGGAPGST
jgi:DNA-binding CsgD family transcriptional regulator/tetratricopeptide (TPR) repeat protein